MKKDIRKIRSDIKGQKSMFVLLISSLLYLFVSYMLSIYGMSSISFNIEYSNAIMFLMLLIAFFSVQSSLLNKLKLPAVIWTATGFAFFSAISTLMNYNTQQHNILIPITIQSFWWSVLIISFVAFRKNNDDKFVSRTHLIFFCVIFILYLQYAINIKSHNIVTPSMAGSIYYVLLFLPFIMMLETASIRNICILLISFTTFLSLKRTAFLALIGSLFVYFIVDYFVSNKKITKRFYLISSVFLVLLISIYMYNFILEKYNMDIMLRFQRLETDGGSGRDTIYQVVWNEIRTFDIKSLIIGKGFNGVELTSSVELSAHNDFLEVLYDYGILGLSLYLAMIFNIIKYNIFLIKTKSKCAGAFSASLTIFLVMSMFSHLIIYPTYFMLIVTFWMWQFVNGGIASKSHQTTQSISPKRGLST
ncbi:MAG TPA: O-antigen ligase family protein [Pseudobacteroides sp.]|uniref:O-antigen ligase family protein n=1 Tax=Pseudobacteroides sp. TaxID=1968840 RepID=UPI002F94A3C8